MGTSENMLENLAFVSSDCESIPPELKDLTFILPANVLIRRTPEGNILKHALTILTNLTASATIQQELYEKLLSRSLCGEFMNALLDGIGCLLASATSKPLTDIDSLCAILINITQAPQPWLDSIVKNIHLAKLIQLCVENVTKHDRHLHFLLNLTQDITIRRAICSDSSDVNLQLFLPLVDVSVSDQRRSPAIGIVKNVCFDDESHDFILHKTDTVSMVLKSLCGPEDELTGSERILLPEAIRHLPGCATTLREPIASLRTNLLETLLQLCSQPLGRKYLWDNGAFLVLQQLSRFENNREVLLAYENVYPIIAGKEPDPEHSHLRTIPVPVELQEEIDRVQRDFLSVD